MNMENENKVHLLPAPRPHVVGESLASEDGLVEQYRRRQGTRHDEFSVEKPAARSPDEINWLGKPRHSAAARRRNEQIDTIATAEEVVEYALRLGLRLEYVGVSESARTITAEVDVFRNLRPNSLEATLIQEALLDSVDRMRQLASQASDQFRRKALG